MATPTPAPPKVRRYEVWTLRPQTGERLDVALTPGNSPEEALQNYVERHGMPERGALVCAADCFIDCEPL